MREECYYTSNDNPEQEERRVEGYVRYFAQLTIPLGDGTGYVSRPIVIVEDKDTGRLMELTTSTIIIKNKK